MPISTTKQMSLEDANLVLRRASVDEIDALGTTGFVQGKVGHRVTFAIATTNVANDTQVISYFDGLVLLLTITAIYTDGTRTDLLSVERTA